jgi:hypothetical protein
MFFLFTSPVLACRQDIYFAFVLALDLPLHPRLSIAMGLGLSIKSMQRREKPKVWRKWRKGEAQLSCRSSMIHRNTVAVGPSARLGCPFPISHISPTPLYASSKFYEYVGFHILAELALNHPDGDTISRISWARLMSCFAKLKWPV